MVSISVISGIAYTFLKVHKDTPHFLSGAYHPNYKEHGKSCVLWWQIIWFQLIFGKLWNHGNEFKTAGKLITNIQTLHSMKEYMVVNIDLYNTYCVETNKIESFFLGLRVDKQALNYLRTW